jgi:hypothetical protein
MNKEKLYFASSISLMFFILGCFFAWNHEIWLDESYHYLLPKSSNYLSQVINNSGYSGHPVFWNLILFYYGIIAPGIYEMQVLHCFIASICIFIIAYDSPFSKLEKILIVFGYFFIYEYNVIAKNYILGLTLLFLALTLFEKGKKLWLISLVLGLAANLHLFTLFVAATLFIYIYIDRYNQSGRKHYLALAIFLFFFVLSAIQIIPPEHIIREYEAFSQSPLLSFERFKRAFGSLSKGLLNIPDFRTVHYWNSNLIYNLSHLVSYGLSAILFFLIFFHFRNTKKLLLLFFTPVIFIMGFVYLAPLSVGTRYWGYYYVLLIICTWLLRRKFETDLFSKVFFMTLLAIQFLVSIPALALDYKLPFSNAKNAALVLRAQKKEAYPLFTEKLALGPSLSAYMNKPVFYPSSKTFETYSFWFTSKKYSALEFIQESLESLKTMKLDTCILVMSQEIPNSVSASTHQEYSINKISVLNNAIVSTENYFLYLLSRKND